MGLSGRQYRVQEMTFLTDGFDAACARAVARSVQTQESVCIETVVRGKVVERIDVTAVLSLDPV